MRLSQIIFVVGFIAFAPVTYGAMNISGTPSGASAYEAATTSTPTTGGTAVTTLPTIYGGLAGGLTNGCLPAAVTGSTTCNNCTASVAACNTTRIYDSLLMVIPLAETGNAGNARLMVTSPAGSTTPIDLGGSLNSVSVYWSAVCAAAQGGSGSCEDIVTGGVDKQIQATIWMDDGDLAVGTSEPQVKINIYILGASTLSTGIDNCAAATSQNGVCFVRAYPGDQKIYIIDAEGSGSFPTSGVRKAKKLRVFVSSINYTNALPTAAEQEVDLNLNDSGDVIDRRVKGLENGKGYFIRVGTVDNANNVDAITSNTNLLSSASDCGADLSAAPTAAMNCAYYAKPDEVLGLLSEDMNCFIANAAYGSSTEKYLDLLREFRFQKLIPYKLGRSFVYQYYKYGPYAARFINDNPMLKPVAQVLLWPVISFSWIALHYGWMAALATLLVSLLAFAALIKVVRNKMGTLRAQ